MYVDYFYWQYVEAPRWLFTLLLNMHTALFRTFSVPFMIRTLFAHWRRDVIPYRGTLTQIATIFAWNQISRVIGLVVRCCVLCAWLISEAIFLAAAIATLSIFILGPLFSLVIGVIGLVLVFQ